MKMRSNYLNIIIVLAILIGGNYKLSAQDVEVETEATEEEGKKKEREKREKGIRQDY
jgi:energy-converting hydrogenase Eha subunit H